MSAPTFLLLALALPPAAARSDGPPTWSADGSADGAADGAADASGHRIEDGDLTARFAVPDGVTVTLWAESPQLYNPTCLDVDAHGRVWVAEAVNYRTWGGRNPGRRHPEGDRVVILEDTDGDGRADASKVFVQDPDLVAPIGLAVVGDSVYVSSAPHLFRYVDEDGDDVPDRRETFLTGFGGHDHDHGLHSVVVGPDGRLWFNAGNAGPHVVTGADGWTLRSGSIYRGGGEHTADNKPGLVSDDGYVWTGGLVLSIEPDGTDLRVHAHNFRNNYEVAVDSYGHFYQADNDDDGNQGCRSLWCLEYGDHGYFSADGTRTWRADQRPGQDTWTAHWHQDDPGVAPAGTGNGAGGPTGGAVLERGPLLAALGADGPAFLNCDAGAGVVYAHRPEAAGAGFELRPGELLRPRAGLEDRGARWFRPSDVVVDNAGAVFVADWYDPGVGGHAARDGEAYGRILRVAPAGLAAASPSLPAADSLAEAVHVFLTAPAAHPRERLRARVRAGGAEAAELLRAAALTGAGPAGGYDPPARARAVSTLVDELDDDAFVAELVTSDASDALREAGVRALRRAGRLAPARIDELGLARDPSPGVRREVALALRDVPLAEDLPLLLDLAERYDGGDRTYLEAFGLAAEGDEEALYAELAAALGDSPLRWDARFEGLAWRLHPAAAVDAQLARATSATLPTGARRRALDALGFTEARTAGEAMLTAALTGPEDLRAYARWWVEFQSGNDWRAYGLGDQLASADMDGAELAWESDVVRAGTVPFAVDVEGADAVWLVVEDGGDGNSCDWANWVDPRFVTDEGLVALADLTWLSAEAQWGNPAVGRNAGGGALRIGDQPVEGLGTHAASTILYAVPAGAQRLIGHAGPDDGGTSQGNQTSVRFQVWVQRPATPPPIAAWTATVLDAAADPDLRREAADALARDPRGALRLVELARTGTLPGVVRDTVAAAIHKNPDLGVRAIAGEQFPVPGASRDFPSLAELAQLDGDPRRGRRLFLDRNRAQCVTCHAYRSGDTLLGGDVGPELTRIREKYDRTALLDAILNPSAGIAFGYDTWVVETRDGLLTSGFVLADGDDLVLKDTQGFRHVIPAEEVVAREKQTLSTMPEGVALGLAPAELADLAAFLLADPAAEYVPGEEVVLFDGTADSMDNWTYHLGDPDATFEDVWSVEDGVLACKGRPAGYLRTKERFESFLLTLEWRFDPARGAGNSGVLLRTVGPDKVWPRSIEAQLQSGNAGDFWNIDRFGMEVDPVRTNGRHTARMQPSSERPLGEWNRYEILVDGPRVELRVNGVLQNTADWCEELPGSICLQSEGAYIEFRDIRLRPLAR